MPEFTTTGRRTGPSRRSSCDGHDQPRRRRAATPGGARPGTVLVALAVAVALGVAVVGGVRSFEAVSAQFGSPLVPLTADGMIIACTALRLAALTRGWRLPGSLLITYSFIAGTVALNVTAAHGWADAVAHALAPISYAVLVEMLAHLLRLHLRLAQPARPRLSFLTWATSPVVTTRVWLHLARTAGDDPVAARVLIQQIIRMSSRLRSVCPGHWPLGRAAAARTAALQTVRDGLLSAETLAGLLPADAGRLRPAVLLAVVDHAALRRTAPTAPERTEAGAPARTEPAALPPHQTDGGEAPRERTDAELVAALHRHGGPLSGRQVMRLLGVGTPKAARLIRLAGWASPDPAGATGAQPQPTPGPLHLVTDRARPGPDSDESDEQPSSTDSGSAS
jgi:hypothetical protein